MEFDAILVPQGAERAAVRRGLQRARVELPTIAIPIGPTPVKQYLNTHFVPLMAGPQPPQRVLLTGLCGSLTPQLAIGDRVVGQTCIPFAAPPAEPSPSAPLTFDRQLSQAILQKLQREHGDRPIASVTGLSGDRMIFQAAEKQQLGQRYDSQAIEMEGFAVLEVLSQRQVNVAMLRVVSDGCDRDLPNLNDAIDERGHLVPIALTLGLLRQPRRAADLIRGSQVALKVLENTIFALFKR